MRSFLDHGHNFELFTYTKDITVPAGVRIRDAREILDEDTYFTRTKEPGAGSPAPFANWFRYKLLSDHGGWWVDTDVICLTPYIPHFSLFFAFQSDTLVNNAVLFSEPGSPLMRRCCEEAARIRDSGSWGTSGPKLLTRVISKMELNGQTQGRQTCYSVCYTDALDFLRPAKRAEIAQQTKSSIFTHLWNEILRTLRVNKTLLPPVGSFLRDIVERHPIAGWMGEYTADQVELVFQNYQYHRQLRAAASRAGIKLRRERHTTERV